MVQILLLEALLMVEIVVGIFRWKWYRFSNLQKLDFGKMKICDKSFEEKIVGSDFEV